MRRALLAALLALAACRPDPLPEPLDLVLPRADDGKPFSLAARRGEATVVWLFATWCVPCQAMEPHVAALARQGPAEGIEVVAIAIDREGRRTVSPWTWGLAPPYPVLVGGDEVASGRSPIGPIPELPATLVLDRDGRPAASISGIAPYELLLDRARTVRDR